jgi:hypothetical protein
MDTPGSSSVGPEGPLDNATAAKLLKDHAVMVTRNVNSIALKPYLLQNNCITLEEAKQFHVESPRSESNLKLISIICQRGVSAFNGFLQALTQFTADEPGEGAHAELLDTLKRETAKIPLSPRRAPDVSNYTAQASISSRYTTQASASSSDVNTEGSTVRGYSPIPEEMEVQPLRADDSVERDMSQPQVAADQRGGGGMPRHMQGDSQEDAGNSTANTEEVGRSRQPSSPVENTSHTTIPMFRGFRWLVSVVMCIFLPVYCIGGVTLLTLSVLGFVNKLECDGVGAEQSLNVFNFFYGLLCLSIPGLLTMFTLYFCCRDRNSGWEKKFGIANKCLVWLTIFFFLSAFILTVLELLYSIAYVAPEVYTQYAEWNETQCDKEIYLTSFSLLTISCTVVFILLVVLGVFLAILYFRWVTDQARPGVLRDLIYAFSPRKERENHSARVV